MFIGIAYEDQNKANCHLAFGIAGGGAPDPNIALTMDNGGNVYVRKNIKMGSGSSLFVDDFRFHNSDSGNYIDHTGDLYFRQGTSAKITFDENGNVGIGTNSPSFPLEINSNTTTKLLVKPVAVLEHDSRIEIRGARTGSTTDYHSQLRLTNYDDGLLSDTDSGVRILGQISGKVSDITDNLGSLVLQTSTDGSTLQDTMTLTKDGNVGIGLTEPGQKLEVNGNIKATNIMKVSIKDQSNSVQTIGHLRSSSHIICDRFRFSGANNNEDNHWNNGYGVITVKRHNGGSRIYMYGSDDLMSTLNQTHAVTLYVNNVEQTSDDRLKENEVLIENATETLMKLKPQKYLKKPNIENNNPEDWKEESGLIAQEIYYDTPELRHLVTVSDDATLNKNNSSSIETSVDPQQDPDYSSWGSQEAYVNYSGFIPYCIKAIQEQASLIKQLQEEIAELKNSTS